MRSRQRKTRIDIVGNGNNYGFLVVPESAAAADGDRSTGQNQPASHRAITFTRRLEYGILHEQLLIGIGCFSMPWLVL